MDRFIDDSKNGSSKKTHYCSLPSRQVKHSLDRFLIFSAANKKKVPTVSLRKVKVVAPVELFLRQLNTYR